MGSLKIAACLAAFLVMVIPVAAGEITACTEINQSGIYYLANDISQNILVCINITASDVVFDGGGHKIIGNSTGYGVYVAPNTQNVTVTELELSGWEHGVYFFTASNIRIENITTHANVHNGIMVENSTNGVITRVYTTNNGWHGIEIKDSKYMNVTDIIAENNAYQGVFLNVAEGIRVYNVTSENAKNCIYLENSNNNVVLDNEMNNCSDSGIKLSWSKSNTISDNSIYNSSKGISLFHQSDGNTVEGNVVVNATLGVYMDKVFQNTVKENYVYNTSTGIGVYSYYTILIDPQTMEETVDESNQGCGWWLWCIEEKKSGNTILDNTISLSQKGVHILDSFSNTVKYNKIVNSSYGIKFEFGLKHCE